MILKLTEKEVTEAVLRMNARGIPCFALLNDFAQGVRQNYLGLNNMKMNDYANVVVQALIRVHPIRWVCRCWCAGGLLCWWWGCHALLMTRMACWWCW